MKLTYNRPNNQINKVKWIAIIFCLIIVTSSVYGVILYQSIEKNRLLDFDNTTEFVLNNTNITKVDAIKRYHGEKPYHVVYGRTNQSAKKIIFVPFKEKDDQKRRIQDLLIIDEDDILSEERVQEQWKNECNRCELIKITPGIENNEPIWELTYKDDTDRHVLEYVSIYDGSPHEKFRFTRMYQ